MSNVLKQKLLLGLNFAKSRLVLGEIIMHVFIRLVQVRDFAVFDLQEHLVVLNLLLQTPNVTLELTKSGSVTTLFHGSVTARIVSGQAQGLTKCSE